MKRTLICILSLISVFCKGQNLLNNEWTTNCTKTILRGNIYFTFPADNFSFNRDSLIQECFSAIKHDLSILNKTQYTDTFTIQFLRSRKEMKALVGSSPSGIVMRTFKRVLIVADKNDVSPPIKHELMHFFSLNFWGVSNQFPHWLNEGLATYAINTCNNFNVEQVYAFMLHKNMLLPIDSLTNSFFNQPDMISYHQSSYTVQYLIEKYGIDKLRQLWQSNFSDFQKIYGVTYKTVESEMKDKIKKKYLSPPNIDWTVFNKGCN
ncbi:MAG: peptidase MA family metallohydrolase [Bacteroidia bacterium]